MKYSVAYLLVVLAVFSIYKQHNPQAENMPELISMAIILISAFYLYLPHLLKLTEADPDWKERDNDVKTSDLKVLEQAKILLDKEENWDKNDDRHCLIWDKKSLFCALALAQKEIEGHYCHRSIPIQEVRFTIVDQYPGRWSDHPIQDFNNHADTTYEDVCKILIVTQQRLLKRLQP